MKKKKKRRRRERENLKDWMENRSKKNSITYNLGFKW